MRESHSPSRLEQLRKSITSTGGPLIPLVVRETEGERYDIISGDGRFQAIKDLGYSDDYQVPCLVVNVSEKDALEFGLVDNVVREKMSPYEEAMAARMLVEDFGLKQSEVAQKLGRDKAYVSHLLSSFHLIPEVIEALKSRRIQFGHARALTSLRESSDQQKLVLDRILAESLPVKETEDLVRDLRSGKEPDQDSSIKPGTVWISSKSCVVFRQKSDSTLIEITIADIKDLEPALDSIRSRFRM